MPVTLTPELEGVQMPKLPLFVPGKQVSPGEQSEGSTQVSPCSPREGPGGGLVPAPPSPPALLSVVQR